MTDSVIEELKKSEVEETDNENIWAKGMKVKMDRDQNIVLC